MARTDDTVELDKADALDEEFMERETGDDDDEDFIDDTSEEDDEEETDNEGDDDGVAVLEEYDVDEIPPPM